MREFLSRCLFFSQLSENELVFLSKTMREQELEKGEVLFEEGDPGNSVCFIMEGALEILKTTDFGDVAVLATLVQGNSIGEMSLLDGRPRSATTRAVVKTRVVVLSKNMFERIINARPRIGVSLLKGLAMALSDNLRETSIQLSSR